MCGLGVLGEGGGAEEKKGRSLQLRKSVLEQYSET